MKQNYSTSQKGFGSVWTGLALSGLLMLSGVSGAQASFIGVPGYSVSSPSTTAGGYSIGFEFMPTNSFDVTALGYWDSGNNGLLGSHEVAIYFAQSYGIFVAGDQVPGASATVVPADSGSGLNIGTPVDGFYAYHPLAAPVRLELGVTYRIAANTFDVADGQLVGYEPLASPANLAPMTTIRGVYDSTGNSLVFYPTSFDPANLYSDPNFLFTTPVPEPSTAAMLTLGGLVVAWCQRKFASRRDAGN